MNWLSVLKCSEDPLNHECIAEGAYSRILVPFCGVSVEVNQVLGVRTHQCYRCERVEAVEYEISVWCLQVVAGRGERGLECPLLFPNPYQGHGHRSGSGSVSCSG